MSGISVFFKDDEGQIFHTYSSFARGNEPLLGAYHYLDLVPKGRNETGPGHNLTDWVRLHDRYAENGSVAACHAGPAAAEKEGRLLQRPIGGRRSDARIPVGACGGRYHAPEITSIATPV